MLIGGVLSTVGGAALLKWGVLPAELFRVLVATPPATMESFGLHPELSLGGAALLSLGVVLSSLMRPVPSATVQSVLAVAAVLLLAAAAVVLYSLMGLGRGLQVIAVSSAMVKPQEVEALIREASTGISLGHAATVAGACAVVVAGAWAAVLVRSRLEFVSQGGVLRGVSIAAAGVGTLFTIGGWALAWSHVHSVGGMLARETIRASDVVLHLQGCLSAGMIAAMGLGILGIALGIQAAASFSAGRITHQRD
jgi:hypothetical protein